jgi:hypothetical protein
MTPGAPGRRLETAERPWLRLENLLTACRRLTEAIKADIAALERGAIDELKTADPEIETLCAFYAREVRALKADGGAGGAPAKLIAALREEGAQLDGQLQIHSQLVGAMREATEGLMQAVAEGVQSMRNSASPYTATPKPKRPPTSAAIVYNKVV